MAVFALLFTLFIQENEIFQIGYRPIFLTTSKHLSYICRTQAKYSCYWQNMGQIHHGGMFVLLCERDVTVIVDKEINESL